MKIKKNISLKNKNWFRTGGSAKYFAEPKNINEFKITLEFAQKNNLEIFVLGGGANILISDYGFDGLVTKPDMKKINIITKKNYCLVQSECSVTIQDLIDHCIKNNIIGLEEFSNIPGTVGGSIYINIHYFDYFLSDFLYSATIINKKTDKSYCVDKNWFNFGYDKSKLQNKEHFLINATFKLKKANDIETAYCKGRRDEIIRQRTRRYPTSNTCGSFFRNFNEKEINFKIHNKKILFVAYYLDKIGIKGELRYKNAIVSEKHSNMIVTLKNTKSSDVINLAKKIQKLTFKKYGIIPQPECQLIGFKKYPLFQFE
ncbi:UDP-N-acetylmuramate dehydrogenase [Candidatus Babeliales bacterium]|nr:UDP-N-acetylmuramate dehydrogenase [Candidatus Babeliales bacterium]